MKFIFLILVTSFLLSFSYDDKNCCKSKVGRCTGSPYCTACSNCSSCKYCSSGGTCGVCVRPNNSRNTSYKKATRASQGFRSNQGAVLSSQCRAITKKGTRCSRASRSNDYCWQHGGWLLNIIHISSKTENFRTMKGMLFMAVLFCISCSVSNEISEEVYFSGVSDYGLDIYPSSSCRGEAIAFIPSHTVVYTKTPRRRKKVYVTYGSINGWVSKPRFENLSRTSYNILPRSITSSQDSLLALFNKRSNYHSSNRSSYTPSYRPKTVHVKGYYRKNGTYVKPYMRSAPRKKYWKC